LRAHLRVPPDRSRLETSLAEAIEPAEPEDGLVFVAAGDRADWEAVAEELGEAFELTQRAARSGAPVVYVVAGEDLLGQRGAGPAMVACGLLSAARTLAFETRKDGVPANVVATQADTAPEVVARWTALLLEGGGPTGELVKLGGAHLGKALP